MHCQDNDYFSRSYMTGVLRSDPPYKMGQLLMCMGASNGIGSGLSLFNNSRNVVVFMGDSTFFHAGLPGVINAIFNKHNITMIMMENGTTADLMLI